MIDYIIIYLSSWIKIQKYFGQARVRLIGFPVRIPYPKCNNAAEIEKTIHLGKYIQTIIIILNNLMKYEIFRVYEGGGRM